LREPEIKQPKVSVCVITYNQEKYIRQCINSILNQIVDFNYEIIIGDDCSTDGTRDIVMELTKEYPEKIRYIFQNINTGGTKNYLDVHSSARGEYISHFDGDDLMLPNKLQRQFNYFEAHPGCSIVWHSVIRFSDLDEDKLQLCSYESDLVEYYHLCDLMKFGPIGNNSSSMYRKGTRDQHIDDEEILDWMFYTENLAKGYGALLHEVLGCYRVNRRNSLGSGRNIFKVKKLMIKHLNEAAVRFPFCRRSIFIGAIIRAMTQIRRNWKLVADYVWLAIKNFSFVSPIEV